MDIPVTCTCKHVTQAHESRAGLSILCEGCGRTLMVPMPEGLDPAEVEEAREHEEELKHQHPVRESVRVWLQENVAAHKGRAVAVALGLVFLSILVWGVVSIVSLLGDTAYRLEQESAEDIRARMKAERVYKAKLEADSKQAEQDRGAAATQPSDGERARQALRAAEAVLYDDRPKAKLLLLHLVETYPDTEAAETAREHLIKIAAREK